MFECVFDFIFSFPLLSLSLSLTRDFFAESRVNLEQLRTHLIALSYALLYRAPNCEMTEEENKKLAQVLLRCWWWAAEKSHSDLIQSDDDDDVFIGDLWKSWGLATRRTEWYKAPLGSDK